jgi:anaerobic magnesium-protoporphyrin IX monomethyl ester cyclase
METIKMQKTIVFLEPPYGWNNEQLDPSFPLMYLAGIAEKCGWEAQIIDMQTIEDPLPKADVYAVTATSPQWIDAVKLSHRLKQEHPESLRMVGGNHTSYDLTLGMPTEYNVCVAGEGEQILEVILRDPKKWKHDEPIAIRTDPIENLDTVPFPARHLVDWKQYKRGIFWGKKLLEPAVGIVQSRGCPNSCIFCDSHVVMGHRTRFRSVGNVVAEMKQVLAEMGYRGFNFHDDTFCVNRTRAMELCREFKKLDVVWRCLTRVNTVDEKLLSAMRDSGCKEIIYGIESYSDLILNNLHKGTTAKQNLHAMKITKKAGIQTKAGIIVGNPGETWATIRETEKGLRECPPDYWALSTLTPYPGSAIWANPEKYKVKLLTRDISQYLMVDKNRKGNVVLETEEMSKVDIEQARDEMVDLLMEISGSGV